MPEIIAPDQIAGEVIQPDEVKLELDAPKRPSNPVKQGFAGLTDIATAMPALAGIIGAGGETIADYALDDNDLSFGDTFVNAISEGKDADLLQLGTAGRNAVNDFLNIKDPKSIEDQAARLITSSAIPGSFGVSTLGKAATFLSPLVRTGPKFARNAGIQLGVGAGIDQGLRAVIDDPELPLMFSNAAIHGDTGEETLSAVIPPDQIAREIISPDQVVSVNKADFRPGMAEVDKALEEAETTSLVKVAGMTALAAATIYGGAKYANKLRQLHAIPGVSDTSPAGKASAMGDALRNVRNSDNKLAALESEGKDLGNRIFGKAFDKNSNIEEALRKNGTPEEDIAQIAAQDVLDAYGIVQQFIKDGHFGQGSSATVKPLKAITQEFKRLPPEEQQVFIDGIAAIQEDIIRTRATAFDALGKAEEGTNIPGLQSAFDTGTVDDIELILKEHEALVTAVRGTGQRPVVGLWKTVDVPDPVTGKIAQAKQFITDPEVKARMDAFNANPAFKQIQRDLVKINEAVLEEAVRRGPMSRKVADAWKTQFTKDGNLIYLPGKEAMQKSAWYKRLATNMGFHSSTGKNLNTVSNWMQQGLTQGTGIQNPLDPFTTTANYALQVMEHTNTSNAQWNVLSRLANIGLDDANLAVLGKGHPNGAISPVKYVGKTSLDDVRNTKGQVHVEYAPDMKLGDTSMTPQQLADMDDLIWVQRNGDYFGFQVKDGHLKTALEFDAALHNRALQFSNFWKNTFTSFTTGQYSLFAPTSFLYNNQMGAVNAFLSSNGGLGQASKEAVQVWQDGVKGAWEMFAARTADDIADLLTDSLERNSGLAKTSPEFTKNVRDALSRRVERSLLNPIERETGKTASSLAASEFNDNLTDILEATVPHISQRYGGNVLPQMARLWKHFNSAMHEGTSVGIAMRKMAGETSPAAIRGARKHASDLVGDVRLRGSSEIGKAMHAAVPFSGAMLQAWATMGRAIKKGGLGKAMPLMVAGIGMPTVLEVAYNNLMDPEAEFPDAEGNMWTYKDYYWKGFTADQRNNNYIIMQPGKPPWEAIVVPVVPELSMMHGLVIDMMEVTMGLSSYEKGEANHFTAGLGRVFDIPLPPPIAAAGSALGLDLRTGIIPDDNDGEGFSFFEGRPLASGERVTPNQGKAKYVGAEMDKEVVGVIQDIFGAAGSAAVAVYEAMNPGVDEPASVRGSFAFDELGRNALKQTRYLQPLFGKAMRPNPNGDTARAVIHKKTALQNALKNVDALESGGTFSGENPIRGNTVGVPTDPIAIMMATDAQAVLDMIKPHDEEISRLRRDISTLGTATRDTYKGRDLTPKTRDELIDALNLQISSHKANQLSILMQQEERFAATVQERIGKDISGFTYNGYKARD